MFGFGRRQSKLRKEELREENGVLQERINSFRKEVRTLREELDSYKAREREIAEALNFARERASEYLKEARLRFALESARLNDFKLRISKRLERVGSAEKVGEELKECELFFAAAAKELEELAAGMRRKNTPEDEYRREIERLKELGSDRPDVHPVEEPQRSVPEFFPPKTAAPDKLDFETQETFRDKNRESVSVKTFPREALPSLKPVRSIFRQASRAELARKSGAPFGFGRRHSLTGNEIRRKPRFQRGARLKRGNSRKRRRSAFRDGVPGSRSSGSAKKSQNVVGRRTDGTFSSDYYGISAGNLTKNYRYSLKTSFFPYFVAVKTRFFSKDLSPSLLTYFRD